MNTDIKSVEKDADETKDINTYRPILKRLYKQIEANMDNTSSLKGLCETFGFNYQSVINAIIHENKKGKDYYKLLNELQEERNYKRLFNVDNIVYKQALDSDVKDQAKYVDLFYKRTNAIKKESTNINVNNNINLTYIPQLPDESIDV
ncbi:MAG TPA: hypothetical protein VLB82_06585 [Thermodesulfobacteriota bacterium]|nr:hypothetical protein [Thermodesulfobacteriota bacterium]